MPAPIGNKNAIGNSGGKSFNDRKIASEVRTLALTKIKKILKGKDSDLQRQLLLRLAGSVLPRLKEMQIDEYGNQTVRSDTAYYANQITGMVIVDESNNIKV